MSGQCGSCPSRQKPKPLIKTRVHVMNRYRTNASGGEFDRERNTIQVVTDTCDCRSIPTVHAERRLNRDGAIHKKAYSVVVRQRLDRELCSRAGSRERGHPERRLARHAERFPACCEYPHLPTLCEQGIA